jgi:twitching motility protein PilI
MSQLNPDAREACPASVSESPSVEAHENLRDFQARLAEKLRAAESTQGNHAKLGILAGGQHWLVNLDQVNEVVTVPQVTRAPWSKPWFIGVSSIRGVIYGCVDFAAYAGIAEAMPRGETRLLLAHPRFGLHVALRVERALGLRPLHDLTPEPVAPASDAAEAPPPWIIGRWRSPDGQVWTEVSVEKLIAMPEFLETAL